MIKILISKFRLIDLTINKFSNLLLFFYDILFRIIFNIYENI